ncbi:hypothetical protein ACIQF6_16830 [Kitasatospora sp. NPDC092948]|uniref:hypothetical protein n=1 Tax=Kitasatospora sp. NPDC092948 TaxID=3364088 RepID=UPI00382BEA5B
MSAAVAVVAGGMLWAAHSGPAPQPATPPQAAAVVAGTPSGSAPPTPTASPTPADSPSPLGSPSPTGEPETTAAATPRSTATGTKPKATWKPITEATPGTHPNSDDTRSTRNPDCHYNQSGRLMACGPILSLSPAAPNPGASPSSLRAG